MFEVGAGQTLIDYATYSLSKTTADESSTHEERAQFRAACTEIIEKNIENASQDQA